MKTKAIVLALIAALLGLSASSVAIQAQSPIPVLPADLLFTASLTAGQGDYPRDVILRVDAETLEVTPFYIDTEAFEMVPLGWSPQGNWLAVYRVVMPPADERFIDPNSTPRQLCLLDRAGALQRCMEDSPPMHWAGLPHEWQSYYPVVWGQDGQTIYFETEYPSNDSISGYGRRIVEASVLTGETLRTVYEYPDPFQVVISPDLQRISVGFGEAWGGSGYPAFVFDLTTGTQFDVPSLMPRYVGLEWLCQPFSPHGSFVAAQGIYKLARYAPELEAPDDYREGQGDLLFLLDMHSTVQHIIGEPQGAPATIWDLECPGWQPDEQAVVFYASNNLGRYLMRYALADRRLTTLYELSFEPGHEAYVHAPFVPSPGGSHIALTVSDGPYEDRLVAVLYPDGNIYRIPSPYRFSLYPLWVPPVSTPPATPTPTETSTPTETPTATPTFTPTPTPSSNLPYVDTFFAPYWETTGRWAWVHSAHNDWGCFAYMWNRRDTSAAYTDTLTLLTPLHLIGATNPTLFYQTIYTLGPNEYARVQVSTDDGQNWVTVREFSNASGGSWGTHLQPPGWTDHQVDLTAYAHRTIRLRFELEMPAVSTPPSAWLRQGWLIDNVQVTADGIPQSLPSEPPCWGSETY